MFLMCQRMKMMIALYQHWKLHVMHKDYLWILLRQCRTLWLRSLMFDHRRLRPRWPFPP